MLIGSKALAGGLLSNATIFFILRLSNNVVDCWGKIILQLSNIRSGEGENGIINYVCGLLRYD